MLKTHIPKMITTVSAIGKEKYNGIPRMWPLWFQEDDADAEDGYHWPWTRNPTMTPVADSTTDHPIQ